MKRIAMITGMTLLVAACSGSGGDADADGDGTVSANEARAAVKAAGDSIKPEPGQYRMKMTFVKADIPGAPPEMMKMFGDTMSNSFEYCLTQEEAEKGFADSLTKGRDENCKTERMKLENGNIDMAMTCADPNAGSMQITMKGKVTPTTTDLTMVTKGDLPGAGPANIEMKMAQERIGDCPV